MPARKPPEALRGDDLFRSLTGPKPLAFLALNALATWTAFGCAREPGELDPLPTPWNADDIALGRCVATCSPDYGPRPITMEECARVEEGLEFFPANVWDWEGADNAYSYQDGTTEFLSTTTPTCTVEDHATNYGIEASCQASYEPTPAPVDRCGSTRALHVRGGPFREWGGGLGRRLDSLALTAATNIGSACPVIPGGTPDASEPPFCAKYDASIANAPGAVYVNPETGEQVTRSMEADSYYLMQVDLREWEGITFWARRGPDSQPGFRVALGDRNTDDDVSMLATAGGIENPRCRRAKECDCRNHRPCTKDPNSADYYCWDPELDESPDAQLHPWNHERYRCGFSACNYRYAAYPDLPDAPFVTKENVEPYFGTASCTSYTFKNDITRMGCFDAENGPPPPESSEKCGDPWFAPVRLSTDWQFFRVPFSELRQEGYGKEFPALDKSAVTMVRFTWSQGWVDYWIDDVRFYRKR